MVAFFLDQRSSARMNIAPAATNSFCSGPAFAVGAVRALFVRLCSGDSFFFFRFFLEKGGSDDGGLLEL